MGYRRDAGVAIPNRARKPVTTATVVRAFLLWDDGREITTELKGDQNG